MRKLILLITCLVALHCSGQPLTKFSALPIWPSHPTSGSYAVGIQNTAGAFSNWLFPIPDTTSLSDRINAKGNGTVTSVAAGAGLTGGTITGAGTISLPNTGTAGTWGSSTQVPQFTTDSFGRVTAVTNKTIAGTDSSVFGTKNYVSANYTPLTRTITTGWNGVTYNFSSNMVLLFDTTSISMKFRQGGNSYGTTARLGTNDSNALNLRTNGAWHDSISAAGVSYLMGDNSATSTGGVVLDIANKDGSGNIQTNHLYGGIGRTADGTPNVPYWKFGSSGGMIGGTGISGYSTMLLNNTTTSATVLRCANSTSSGGVGLIISNVNYTAGPALAPTSGTYTYLSVGDASSGNNLIAPISGNADIGGFSPGFTINESGTASGVRFGYSDTRAVITSLTGKYAGVYLTKNSGTGMFGLYQTGTADNCLLGKFTVGSTTSGAEPLNVTGNVNVSATAKVLHLKGNGIAPTITAGTGAGASPTLSVISGSTDMSGWVSLTAGTVPATSATVFTLTYNTAYSSTPKVVISPCNSAAKALLSASQIYVDRATGITTTTFIATSGATALTFGTTYEWTYQVIE